VAQIRRDTWRRGNEPSSPLTPRARELRRQGSWLRNSCVVRSNQSDRHACRSTFLWDHAVTSHQLFCAALEHAIASSLTSSSSAPNDSIGSSDGVDDKFICIYDAVPESNAITETVFEPMLNCKHPNIAPGATPIGSAIAHPIEK